MTDLTVDTFDDTPFVVIAPLIIVDLRDGNSVQLLRGQVVPDNARQHHLDHLLQFGMIERRVVTGGLQ